MNQLEQIPQNPSFPLLVYLPSVFAKHVSMTRLILNPDCVSIIHTGFRNWHVKVENKGQLELLIYTAKAACEDKTMQRSIRKSAKSALDLLTKIKYFPNGRNLSHRQMVTD